MRAILALGCLLVLSACDYDLSSKTAVIPEAVLVDPKPFAGNYWKLSPSNESQMNVIALVEEAGRRLRLDVGGMGPVRNGRLLHLAGPDDFLMVVDVELMGRSDYWLFRRLDAGAIEMSVLYIPGDNPFTAANYGYLNDVAARYGLQAQFTEGRNYRAWMQGFREDDEAPADPAIVDLVRERDFLAMLSTRHEYTLLPMNAGKADPEMSLESDGSSWPREVGVSAPAAIAAVGGRAPDDLAGLYEIEQPSEGAKMFHSVPLPQVSWRREDDGHFVSDELQQRGVFYPLAGEEPTYAGVLYSTEEMDDDSERQGTLVVLMRDEGCWNMADIGLSRPLHVKGLEKRRWAIMRGAAKHHALAFDEAVPHEVVDESFSPVLGGIESIDALAPLLHDGRFTMGLAIAGGAKFCPPGYEPPDENIDENKMDDNDPAEIDS